MSESEKMQFNSQHILVYCADFVPQNSGYVHAFTQLIENMADQGKVIHVVTPYPLPDGLEEYIYPNVIVYRYAPKLPLWFFGWLYRSYKLGNFFQELNERYQFELILVETGDDPMLFPFLPKYLVQKTVVRFHATSDTEYLVYSTQKKYRIKYFLWKYLSTGYVKHVAATSDFHLQFVRQQFHFDQFQCTYHKVVNAIETQHYDFIATETSRRFVILGRMDVEGYRQKGYSVLLEALKLIKDDFTKTGSTFTIIGKGVKQQELISFVQQNDLHFVKVISSLSHAEVNELLLRSDIVVLPSVYEGLSMFALEAISTANAVVFSKTGGLVEMVEHNGSLVEPNNVEQLAQAIKTILYATNIDEMKKDSMAIGRLKFSKQTQWLQIEALLNDLKNEQDN